MPVLKVSFCSHPFFIKFIILHELRVIPVYGQSCKINR